MEPLQTSLNLKKTDLKTAVAFCGGGTLRCLFLCTAFPLKLPEKSKCDAAYHLRPLAHCRDNT